MRRAQAARQAGTALDQWVPGRRGVPRFTGPGPQWSVRSIRVRLRPSGWSSGLSASTAWPVITTTAVPSLGADCRADCGRHHPGVRYGCDGGAATELSGDLETALAEFLAAHERGMLTRAVVVAERTKTATAACRSSLPSGSWSGTPSACFGGGKHTRWPPSLADLAVRLCANQKPSAETRRDQARTSRCCTSLRTVATVAKSLSTWSTV